MYDYFDIEGLKINGHFIAGLSRMTKKAQQVNMSSAFKCVAAKPGMINVTQATENCLFPGPEENAADMHIARAKQVLCSCFLSAGLFPCVSLKTVKKFPLIVKAPA